MIQVTRWVPDIKGDWNVRRKTRDHSERGLLSITACNMSGSVAENRQHSGCAVSHTTIIVTTLYTLLCYDSALAHTNIGGAYTMHAHVRVVIEQGSAVGQHTNITSNVCKQTIHTVQSSSKVHTYVCTYIYRYVCSPYGI